MLRPTSRLLRMRRPLPPVDAILNAASTSGSHAYAARITAGPRHLHSAAANAGGTSEFGGEEVRALQEKASARLHRFYVSQSLARGGTKSWCLEDDEAKHIKVLRLAPGDSVELCDGQGNTVEAIISALEKQRVWVDANGPVQAHAWEGTKWTVAVACTTLKGGRADWLVEKACELGAWALIPLITERSDAGSKGKFKTARKGAAAAAAAAGGGGGGAGDAAAQGEDFQPAGRLERLAIAATKQSLRAHALQLLPPQSLQQVLQQVHADSGSLVAVGGAPPLRQVMDSIATTGVGRASETRFLFIGPEGDFTPNELEAMFERRVSPVGLGQFRLRCETAAIGLLAAVRLS